MYLDYIAEIDSFGSSGRRPDKEQIRSPVLRLARQISRLLPGVALCGGIALAADVLQQVEQHVAGRVYIEAIVMAILLGVAARSLWVPGPAWAPGISFSAKPLLELAVMLLGASLNLHLILGAGIGLLLGIATVVTASLLASYAVGRIFGLPHRLSLLVACGNSICGNSAIAAVAPVIEAEPSDVASSITFTAVLGVAMVLGLPLLVPLLHLSPMQYGVFAGLTVYAVPQVLAATLPVSLVSTQIGTMVKLVRVLMLGPVVLMLSLVARRFRQPAGGFAGLSLSRFVPWFIIGFVVLASLRSLGIVPTAAFGPLTRAATLFTIVSMAALGLGVDLRAVARAGGRVIASAATALVVLSAMSGLLIGLLDLR